MKRSCSVVAALVALLAHVPLLAAQPPGAAQAPGAAQPTGEPTAVFLEKRVPDELATEGVVLSRDSLSLKVEQIGSKWLVSLIDLNTGRVAASTKLDELPPDREAAVAVMTQVVSALASQAVREPPPAAEAPPPPAGPPGTPSAPVLTPEQQAAEANFEHQAMRFTTTYRWYVASDGEIIPYRRWHIYQGAPDHEIDPEAFYTAVGRPDLYDGYKTRRGLAIGGVVVAGAALIASVVLLIEAIPHSDDCTLGNNFSSCVTNDMNDQIDREKYLPWLGLSGAIAIASALFGGYFFTRPHPINGQEAYSLADAYNQHLRQNLSLPPLTRREPLLQDLRLAPVATSTGGGFALTGRF